MTIATFCIVLSLFIPLFCAGFAKLSVKGYNNSAPREFLANQKGKCQRANWAQQNFYETFPGFAAGVILAQQTNAAQSYINAIALIYVIARILYAIFYISDNHKMRSISWFISFTSIISLYFIGI